jgi:Mrp family chromosome partitioning ATPase
VAAEALLAEKSARLDDLAKRLPPGSIPAAATAGAAAAQATPARDVVVEYGSVLRRMDTLEKSLEELLNEFTDESPRVKDVRGQLAELDKQRVALLAKYPALSAPTSAASAAASNHAGGLEGKSDNSIDLVALTTEMAGLRSKIKFLRSELDQYHQAEANVDQLEGTILDLQRQKELDETNYKYYSTHLESTRIDEALGAGRALNLAEIQQPTPPGIDYTKSRKLLAEIAVGGLVLGLGWAFLIEYYFDRSLRRPQDIEKALSVPLFLSIPDFGVNGHNRNVFHETLRDRLIAFFESKGMTHKPKLLAVTGVDKASGVTSTASGLAQSLSQTGEGNVLLVDMTQSQGSVQQFCQGKEVCDLDKLLDTRNNAQVQEKLFVVGAEPSSDKLSRALPSRFNRLVPQLKASDFDYIIFDMPAVNQISITPRLAQFMDMVLLVVESEKTDKDLAKQAATMLAQGQTNLGIILNKTRNYVPSRAQHEFLGSG